jgi:hypothetical protein
MSIEMITQSDLKKMIPKFKRALQRTHDLTTMDLLGNLQEYSPQETGRLAGSWRAQNKGFLHSVVGTNVKYALVHNDGSDPYMIYPRSKKVLRFKVDGQWVFAKEVLHPGINPTHYIDGAISATNKRIAEFVEMGLDSEGL